MKVEVWAHSRHGASTRGGKGSRMSMPYPTNHKRPALTVPNFDALDRTILEGRCAHSASDNPYIFKTAEWIAWQYGFNTR